MKDERCSCKAHPKTAWIILCRKVTGCSAKLPGTCLHNYLRDARLRLGGAELLAEEKITTCTRATGSR